MRTAFCLVLMSISLIALSQEAPAKTKNKLESAVSFSLNSNGIASIPAFSLDKPALVAAASIVKGRFSFDPTLAYSIEMKPWYIDNWLHYKIISKPDFDLRAGVNFSTFCSGLTINEEEILKAERYFAFAITGIYRFSPVTSLSLDYWSDNGQEKGSLSGHFISLAFDRSEINLGKKAYSAVNMMLFYINYDGNNDGFFVSPKISFALRNIPFAVFFQANGTIQSNISPSPGFKWNIGMSYTL